jgi:hypothetical protein
MKKTLQHMNMKWITASDITNWANTKKKHCADTLPELIRRLISATVPSIEEIDFPAGDSTSSGGWDGRLRVPDTVTSSSVPSGISGWEIGAEKSSGVKAEEDYKKRSTDPRGFATKETTYVCVTPRIFPDRDRWQAEKRQEGVWKDVRVIAADVLENWIGSAPAVGLWLARQIGNAVQGGTRDLEDAWNEWSLATDPVMTVDLVIAGRLKEVERVQQWIASKTGILAVRGDSPNEALAFLYAAMFKLKEQERMTALSRCVVVNSLDEFRAIQLFKSPLIIAAPGECVGAAAAASGKGHQVYIMMDATVTGIRNDFLTLPRPLRDAVEDALLKSGLSKLESQKASRDFGRSIPVLHRNRSVSSVVRNPAWASADSADILLPALFAGSWSEEREGDQKALETLSGMSYQDFSKKLGVFLSHEDSPIRKVGPVWAFKSPLDAWFLIAPHINEHSLKLFKQVVHSVLTETDPKYELSPEKRWTAAVYGKVSQYSGWLRTGLVESLILLAVYGDRSLTVSSTQAFVDAVVKEILAPAKSWKTWSSFKSETPLLAEAAPIPFLDSLESLIKSTPSALQELMKDDTGSIFDECKHSGVLWALEALAWSPMFFARAVTALADLAKLDPGGKWSNRPLSSLFDVFLPVHPQTYATPEERIAAIERLISADPAMTWEFCQKYFHSITFSESHMFRWRYAGGERRGLEPEPPEQREKYLDLLLPILRNLACMKENVVVTAKAFIRLPDDTKEQFLKSLGGLEPEEQPKKERDLLLTHLREQLSWINSYGDEKIRAYGPNLKEALDRLAPTNVIERVGWLLSNPWPKMPEGAGTDFQANDKVVAEAREKAAREVLDHAPLPEIFDFARTTNYARLLGHALGKAIKSDEEDITVLDAMLPRISETPDLIVGYAMGRIEVAGAQWVPRQFQRLKSEGKFSTEAGALILGALPEGPQIWSMVNAEGKEVEHAYWKRASGRAGGDERNLSLQIEKLLEVDRPFAALEVAGRPNAEVPTGLLVSIIKGILASDREDRPRDQVMEEFYLGHVFKQLHDRADIELDQLASLEWPLAPLFEELARYTTKPFAIHRVLQKDPLFFANLVSYMYKRDDRGENPDTAGFDVDQAKNLARAARDVIESWKLLPGLQEDGSIDESELGEWVDAARQACAKSGHVTGCDLQIGVLLSRAPADKDGIWPSVAVRNLIEHLKNKVIDDHIPYGIYNSRGVVSRSLTEGGVKERNLSEGYKKMSEVVRAKWPRTAAILDSMAGSYESDARWEDEHAALNDLRFG